MSTSGDESQCGVPRTMGQLLVLVAAAWVADCAPMPVTLPNPPPNSPSQHPASLAPVAPAGSAAATPPAVAAPAMELRSLAVEGYGPAVVSVPRPPHPRPLLVVAHGAGGRPEWHCALWADVVQDRGFVLCPRGRRTDFRIPYPEASSYFPDHHYLLAATHSAVASLARAYPDQVAIDGAVFAGYSQGAIMGALMVARAPSSFPRACFIEGGGAEWNVPIASRFRDGGGQRIAFLCGVASCAARAQTAQGWLQQAGVPTRAEHVVDGGHTSGGAVAQRLPELFEWLVAGDPRWATDPH